MRESFRIAIIGLTTCFVAVCVGACDGGVSQNGPTSSSASAPRGSAPELPAPHKSEERPPIAGASAPPASSPTSWEPNPLFQLGAFTFAPHLAIAVMLRDGRKVTDRDQSSVRADTCAGKQTNAETVKNEAARVSISERCNIGHTANDASVELFVQTNLQSTLRGAPPNARGYAMLGSYVWSSQFDLPRRKSGWTAKMTLTRAVDEPELVHPLSTQCQLIIGHKSYEYELRRNVTRFEHLPIDSGLQPLQLSCELQMDSSVDVTGWFVDAAVNEDLVLDVALHSDPESKKSPPPLARNGRIGGPH
jgi:hypothetical protein